MDNLTNPTQSGQKFRNLYKIIGVLLIVLGIVFNKWAIGWFLWYYKKLLFFVPGYFKYLTPIRIALIFLAQAGMIFAGWKMLTRKSTKAGGSGAAQYLTVLGLGVAILFFGYTNLRALYIIDPDREIRETLGPIEESEELIFSFSPIFSDLAKSVKNITLPAERDSAYFADSVAFKDITFAVEKTFARPASGENPLTDLSITAEKWQLAEKESKTGNNSLNLWRPFLDGVEYLQFARFAVKKGQFLNPEKTQFETLVLFDGRAQMKSGELVDINTKQIVDWRQKIIKESQGDSTVWQIHKWQTKSFETMRTPQAIFGDVLNLAIPDRTDLHRARRSLHEEYIVEQYHHPEKFSKPHELFSIHSGFKHPGLAVVDLDQDGFDDFYVMPRWGENMFFHNQRNGTFKEIAADIGLNIDSFTTSAIFVDFDNDGDKDAVLGRTLKRSLILINEKGKFVDRSLEALDEPMPYLVTSISVADDNGDGLLDIYMATYASHFRRDSYRKFLPPAEAKEWERLEELAMSPESEAPLPLNSPGPQNVFLRNLGNGKFTTAVAPELRLYRETFQSSWSDFDDDGDPDLYVANDFAPNNLFRNDGDGKFVDITQETNTADVGFGMGVAWGDYDNDGAYDIYTTNMYSKAGQRIVGQLSEVDSRFLKAAHGNTLFRQVVSGQNEVKRTFEKVSGLSEPDLLVEKGGWGWGSQFMDVNNDGFLDIYALSGYYTSPQTIAKPGDT